MSLTVDRILKDHSHLLSKLESSLPWVDALEPIYSEKSEEEEEDDFEGKIERITLKQQLKEIKERSKNGDFQKQVKLIKKASLRDFSFKARSISPTKRKMPLS